MTVNMGNTVIYRDFRRGGQAEEFPGIVLRKYGETDMVDLIVFSTIGTRYINRVKFSSDLEDENTWHWPLEPKAKSVQLPAEKETVPPLDKGPDTAQDGA